MGVVREHSTRLCRVTGRKAIAWELTGNKPQKVNLPVVQPPSAADTVAFLAEIKPLLATKLFLQPGTNRMVKYLEYKVELDKQMPHEEDGDAAESLLDMFCPGDLD